MAWHDPFLLGPLGAMRPLPGVPVGNGVSVPYGRIGGMSRALRGRGTVDVWAQPRGWAFGWDLAHSHEARSLIARVRAGAPSLYLRMLDAFTPNLLTPDTSVCGAESRIPASAPSADGPWGAPSSGTVTLDTVGLDLPADTDLVGAVDAVSTWTTTAAANLNADSFLWRRVPMLGRPVCFSAYVRGTGQVSPRLWLAGLDGNATNTRSAADVALTSAWQRISVSRPAGVDFAACYPHLRAAGAATVQTTGWQLEHALAPTPWGWGGGCPEVFVTKFGDGYRTLNRRALELELEEVL